jgi:uncharacterized membrane protein YtjA (UPF0391 family)
MWFYAVTLFGIAVIAEVLGLGGTPAKAVAVENMLFIALFLTFIVTAFKSFLSR